MMQYIPHFYCNMLLIGNFKNMKLTKTSWATGGWFTIFLLRKI